jgi:hypothetical protein
MRRLALCGSAVIVAHIGAVGWHLLVVSHIHPGVTLAKVKLFTGLINVLPIAALITLWTRFSRFAALLMLIALGVGLAIGGYEHFLSAGTDSVFRMAPGVWTKKFRASATLLLMLEIAGCWIAVRILMPVRTKQAGLPTSGSAVEVKR